VTDGPIHLAELDRRSVDDLAGVGPKKLAALRSVGIETILDLLMFFPRKYLDRTHEARIRDLTPGDTAMVLAKVRSVETRRGRGGKAFVTGTVADSSGSMKVTFFNQNWRERQLPSGTEAIFFGKLELFGGTRQMTNPVVDLVGNRTGRILPVYPQSEKSGLSTWEIGEFVAQVLRRTRARGLADPLDDELRDRLGLVDRDRSYRSIHDPADMADSAEARRRLVFDELLRIQLALVQRKVTMEHTAVGMVHAVGVTDGVAPGLARSFRDRLPYQLTVAQERVIAEIDADLLRPTPMHRLLQGDVGSGKTVIAAHALLVAVQGGHQGAFMAPTEVLAEQVA
jgi:ATP-dependent DNA helicase RecG